MMNKMQNFYDYVSVNGPTGVYKMPTDASFIKTRYVHNFRLREWCNGAKDDKDWLVKISKEEWDKMMKQAEKEGEELALQETNRINNLIAAHIKGYITDEDIQSAETIKYLPLNMTEIERAGMTVEDVRQNLAKLAKDRIEGIKRKRENYCRQAIFYMYGLYYEQVERLKTLLEILAINAKRDKACKISKDIKNCHTALDGCDKIIMRIANDELKSVTISKNLQSYYVPDVYCRIIACDISVQWMQSVQDAELTFLAGNPTFEAIRSNIKSALGVCIDNRIKGTIDKNEYYQELGELLSGCYDYLMACDDFDKSQYNAGYAVAKFLCNLFKIQVNDNDTSLHNKIARYARDCKKPAIIEKLPVYMECL